MEVFDKASLENVASSPGMSSVLPPVSFSLFVDELVVYDVPSPIDFSQENCNLVGVISLALSPPSPTTPSSSFPSLVGPLSLLPPYIDVGPKGLSPLKYYIYLE